MSSKYRNKVVYYTSIQGDNPVKDFIDSLPNQQKIKIFNVFRIYQESGLMGIMPHTKHLAGSVLWEIKIDKNRILYVAQTKFSILVLHGFPKKKQKTPPKEIKTAYVRLKIWNKTHTP